MITLRPWIKFALICVLLLFLTVLVLVTWFQQWRESQLPIETNIVLQVHSGDTLNRITQRLHGQGLEIHPWQMRILAEIENSAERVQAGEYQIRPGATPESLLGQLVNGAVMLHDIRISEGVGVRELLAQLQTQSALESDVLAHDAASLLENLPELRQIYSEMAPLASAEGLFLPDTFHFARSTPVSEVLLRSAREMHQILFTTWNGRDPGSELKSPYELLVLASIIEKETALETDRATVSQVFHSRLKLDMRLQTDPTVIYALGERFDGDLRRADLRVESPFNTYRVKGLPPTPIALPSIASLQAAAHPANGDYLYFVASEHGKSVFSRTLEAHNKAVRKYQLRGR